MNYNVDIFYEKDFDHTVIRVYNKHGVYWDAFGGKLLTLCNDAKLQRLKRQVIKEFLNGKEKK